MGWSGILNASSIQFRLMHKPVCCSKDTKIFSFTERQAQQQACLQKTHLNSTQWYFHVKKCHISRWGMCALKTCFILCKQYVKQHCITLVLFGFSSKSCNQMPGGLMILNDKWKQQYSLYTVTELHRCSSIWCRVTSLGSYNTLSSESDEMRKLMKVSLLVRTLRHKWCRNQRHQHVFLSFIWHTVLLRALPAEVH